MIPPSGIGLWIVNVGGRAVSDVVARAKRAGLGWIAPRVGDTTRNAGWIARGKQLVQACRAEGIGVYPWMYVRPGAAVDLELRHLELTWQLEQPDGLILDAELEWETSRGGRADAARLMASLRAALGEDPFIAHAPFAWCKSHPTFPYAEFGARCQAVMPQAYWSYRGAAAQELPGVDAQWALMRQQVPEAVPALMPIGVTYGSELAGTGEPNPPTHPLTRADVDLFLQRYGSGASLYSWDAAKQEVWDLLDSYAAARAVGPGFAAPDDDDNPPPAA